MKQHFSNKINLFEAKTHFSSLIQRVQDGEKITIFKHNTPVAVLMPISSEQKRNSEDIVEEFRAFNKDKTLAPYTIKELITEGRR